MPIFYKLFKPSRTALCGLFLCLSIGFFAPPADAESYVVEGVQVDISANNAIAARDQAFAEAQRKALKALAIQFMDPVQAASFEPPDAASISPMVRDFEVTQEKLSTTRYIGSYTFRFKESAVQQYFGSRSGPVEPIGPRMEQADGGGSAPSSGWTQDVTAAAVVNSNVPRQVFLVLPFYQTGRAAQLWSPYNGWMAAWRRATLPASQIVPLGDLTDVADISDGQALSYDQNSLIKMLVRYSAREAVVAIATPDEEYSRASTDASIATGTLRVAIFRTDRRDGPEQSGEIAVTAMQNETRGRVFDRAVNLVQRTLGTEWKNNTYVSQSMSSGDGGDTIEMRVPFDNLQQWAAAQRILNRTQGVNDVILKSLTQREARVGVVYNGNPDALRIALQQQGMTLSDGSGGMFDLYMGGQAPAPASYAPPRQPQQQYAPQYAPQTAPQPQTMQAPNLQNTPRAAPRYNGEQPYVNTF